MSHGSGERCSSRRTGKGRFGQAAPLLLETAASRRVAELGQSVSLRSRATLHPRELHVSRKHAIQCPDCGYSEVMIKDIMQLGSRQCG